MKKLLLCLIGVTGTLLAMSQQPVRRTFTAKKVSDKTYELHLFAMIKGPSPAIRPRGPDKASLNRAGFLLQKA